MMPNTQISRRTALKGMVGAAALGGGGVLLSGGGAAQVTSSFDANDVTIATDTGDVNEVHLLPTSVVEWENFDVPITKVRQTMFARLTGNDGPITATPDPNPVEGEDGWWPIYRGTPWLFETGVSSSAADFDYNGSPAQLGFEWPYMNSLSVSRASGKLPATSGTLDYLLNASPDTGAQSQLYVVQEGSPRPTDYAESTLTGVSIGGAPDRANGAYGTVGDTSDVDNATDGTSATVVAELGLLTTLHTDYDFAENVTLPSDPNPDRLSPLAMGNSPDVSHQFGDDTHAIPYANLVANEGDHPAVTFDRVAFDVTAENEPSEQGSQTTANTGGS